MPLQNIPHRLVGNFMTEFGQRAHDPVVAPAGILFGHLHNKHFQLRFDSRPAGVAAVFGAIELPGDKPPVPSQMVSGLATHATWARAFRPSRLPISAKADLSGSDKRNRVWRCARKTRFSAAKYSFCSSSSWFTRPVTYASRRIHLVSFIWNGHNTLPVQLFNLLRV